MAGIFSQAPIDTIRCAADLKRLLEKQKLHWRPQIGAHITVELPWLPPHEREGWSDILTKYSHQCGCGYGAAFLLAGGVLLLVYFIVYGFRPFGLWYLVVGPLFLIVLSGVGKALGILWSSIQLRRSVNHLLAISRSDDVASRGSSGASRTLNVPLHDSARKRHA